jgi:Holliday junction DNA helicase RuvB
MADSQMSRQGRNVILAPEVEQEESLFEASLRPRALSEYIGQEKVKSNLAIFIEAAKARGEALDHVLLYGPPGLEDDSRLHRGP